MKIISWNCRGLGSKAKEEAIRSTIRIETPNLLLIQETKMEEAAFIHSSHSFWNKGGGLAISSRGASGDLGSLWNASKFLLLKAIPNTHWLFLKLQLIESKDEISL